MVFKDLVKIWDRTLCITDNCLSPTLPDAPWPKLYLDSLLAMNVTPEIWATTKSVEYSMCFRSGLLKSKNPNKGQVIESQIATQMGLWLQFVCLQFGYFLILVS